MKYDLSLLVPGINVDLWVNLHQQMVLACQQYTWEIIFCGPKPLPESLNSIPNIKYIKDMGTPTRAFQLASLLTEGEFLAYCPDDSFIVENTLDECIVTLRSVDSYKDIVCLQWFEAVNHAWQPRPKGWYSAGYHGSLRLSGVNPEWKIPCNMMMSSKYYHYLGGIDCRFEHMNMNLHDLMFRAQRNGSIVHFSPNVVLNQSIEQRGPGHPIEQAYREVDLPLFQQLYSSQETVEHTPISLVPNLSVTDNIWRRRYNS